MCDEHRGLEESQNWPKSQSYHFLAASILPTSHAGLHESPYHSLGIRKPNGEGATPALSGLPRMKLICNAKQHEKYILLALKTCANSPGTGKWQRLTFWCYFLRHFLKIKIPIFCHSPEWNRGKWSERKTLLKYGLFFVCSLLRMPMPAGYRGIQMRAFPSFQIKKQGN